MPAKRRGLVSGALSDQEVDRKVAKRRENHGPRTAPNATAILAKRYVPNVEQTVLDSPVRTAQPEEPFGVGLFARKARDPVGDLRGGVALDRASAFEAKNLLETGPVGVPLQHGGRDDAPVLDATVPFVRPAGLLSLGGGEPTLPRGKVRRRSRPR